VKPFSTNREEYPTNHKAHLTKVLIAACKVPAGKVSTKPYAENRTLFRQCVRFFPHMRIGNYFTQQMALSRCMSLPVCTVPGSFVGSVGARAYIQTPVVMRKSGTVHADETKSIGQEEEEAMSAVLYYCTVLTSCLLKFLILGWCGLTTRDCQLHFASHSLLYCMLLLFDSVHSAQ
jgi:hypothetical protein